MPTPVSELAPSVALPWIVALRFGLAAAICLVVLSVHHLLGIDLPWKPMLVFPGLIALSNLILSRRIRDGGTGRTLSDLNLLALLFVLDILCLTGLFMLAGGPSNPFSVLYLVHITLSASILPRRHTWILGILAILCFGLLFAFYHPIHALEHHGAGHAHNLHLYGMWIAFAVAAVLVAVFSGEISEILRNKENSLLAMQAELARKDRLAAMVTLAAGAAHELSTPLGTIAVIARDMEHSASTHSDGAALAEDCALIRAEVGRCQQILTSLSIQGAEPPGEPLTFAAPEELLDGFEAELPGEARIERILAEPAAPIPMPLPAKALRQAILALVKNAVEAGPVTSPVRVKLSYCEDALCLEVSDRGAGMTEEQLRRIGEPFFTTKPAGAGMGLGVFLVRSFADRFGGSLHYRSSPGTGTVATLTLPRLAGRQPGSMHD
jgi:two-component system, sensor histidine kinase RegB